MTDAPVLDFSTLLGRMYHTYSFGNIERTDFKNVHEVTAPEDIKSDYFALTISLTDTPKEDQIASLSRELDTLFTKKLGIEAPIRTDGDALSFFFNPERSEELVAFFKREDLKQVAARAEQLHNALGLEKPDRRRVRVLSTLLL